MTQSEGESHNSRRFEVEHGRLDYIGVSCEEMNDVSGVFRVVEMSGVDGGGSESGSR